MSSAALGRAKIFIAAPREMSAKRFTQIVKHYLPKGEIVLGLSEEEYVVGFEGQPQFTMLQYETVKQIIEKVENSNSPHKITVHHYSQKDVDSVMQQLREGQRVLLVNGSWKYAFHNLSVYNTLTENGVPVKFLSPFADEDEAKLYEKTHSLSVEIPPAGTQLSESEMFDLADSVSRKSYDYSFQIGVALGKQVGTKYALVMTSYNKVIPYQTYALHYGNSREKHLSPPHDANHYDTIHAEMNLLVQAAKQQIDLSGTTLFINVLPCPNCARTLSQTNIDGIVYRHDHSDGYAADLLKMCGKKVKRVS